MKTKKKCVSNLFYRQLYYITVISLFFFFSKPMQYVPINITAKTTSASIRG